MWKILVSTVFCFLNLFVVFGQVEGDFRSITTGDWTSLSTWERFNGTQWEIPNEMHGYPGQFAGTKTVIIQFSHNVSVGALGIATEFIEKIEVQNAAALYLNGSNSLTDYFFNTLNLTIVPGGTIRLVNKVKITLPVNAVFYVTENGFVGDCNNNIQIWIGSVQYATCAGAPGTIFTFAQLMDATSGGTLNAIPMSNTPLCEGETIELVGTFSGAIGTLPTYSWVITTPSNDIFTSTSQNFSIHPSESGLYSAELTVLTYLNGMPYSNTETHTVIVESYPTLQTILCDPVFCDFVEAEVFMTGLVPNATFSLNYSIQDIVQPTIANIQSNSFGEAQVTTVPLQSSSGNQTIQIINLISNSASCISNFNDNQIITVVENGSWIGRDDNEWFNENNWCGGVPTETTQVSILSIAPNQPVIEHGNAVCESITVQSGASLTISPTGTFTTQTFTNNGSVLIQSSLLGDGSCIAQNGIIGSGTFSVERYLSANMWHLVSSPITNAFSEVFLDIWLRSYNEAENTFGEYIVPTTIPLNVAQGFSVWTFAEETRLFQGTVNNGTIGPISLEKSNEGWNLLGNPFPSAIDWLSAVGWTKNNVADAVYIWNNNQYASFINGVGVNGGSRYIAMGQGFFVQALDNNASISLTSNVQIHNPIPFKQDSYVNPYQFRFVVHGGAYSDETVFYEDMYAHSDFDSQRDATKFYGSFNSPQLYSQKNDVMTAIHAIPSIDMLHDKVLFFESNNQETYQFSFTQNFTNNAEFIVIDNVTNDTIRVNEIYSFMSNTNEKQARFTCKMLEKSYEETSIQEHAVMPNFYILDNVLYITTCSDKVHKIQIQGIDGKTNLTTNSTVIPLLDFVSGVYILQIETSESLNTYKFIK